MIDHPSSAAEHDDPIAETKRRAVCEDCNHARADLLADLGAVPSALETAEQAKMQEWVAVNLSELKPRDLAVTAALTSQADEQQFDASFDLTTENPAEIEPDLHLCLDELLAQRRHAETTGQITDGVPAKVPAEVGVESQLLTTETDLLAEQNELSADRTAELATNEDQLVAKTEKAGRNAELTRLQTVFDKLLADGTDTAPALRFVIGQAENLETQRHLQALLHRVTALQVALPGKADLIQSVLRSVPLDLAAPTIAASITGFLTAADSNPEFTEDDRATIRRAIEQTEHDLHTGTKVYEAALATTTDPVTGESIPLHTAENKAEVLPGVHAFTETGHNVLLEMKTPRRRMTMDVTGYDGATIGLIAEAMGFQAHLEELKANAFVREVYGVDFGLLGDPCFDPLSLITSRRRLTALMGGGAGYDGSIFDPRDKSGLILAQMRLTSPTNSADGWGQDLQAAQAHIRSLGLQSLAVLEEFGRYTRLRNQLGTLTPNALRIHLHMKFPNFVAARTKA